MRRLGGLVAVVLLLAGCGGQPLVEDGEYVATPEDVSAQVLSGDLRLTWDDDEVTVETGCTTLSGTADVEETSGFRDATLQLGDVEVESTCTTDDPDAWVEAFLAAELSVERGEDGGFQLFDEEVVVRFSPA